MLQVRYTSFWAGRSGLEQVLLVAVGLLLVLSCSCVLALVLAQQPRSCANTNIRMLHPDHPAHCRGGDTSSPAPSPAPAPVCLETECVTVAAGIIQAADFSADPCEDFYQVPIYYIVHPHFSTPSNYPLYLQYACGGWMDANPIPDGKSSWNTFKKLWQNNQNTLR